MRATRHLCDEGLELGIMMISIVIGSVLVRGEFHFINIILLARFLGQRAQYKVTPANNKEDNITHHFLLGNLMVLDMCAHGPWTW